MLNLKEHFTDECLYYMCMNTHRGYCLFISLKFYEK